MSTTQFKNSLKLKTSQPDGACCPVRRFLVRINDSGSVKTFETGLQTPSRVGSNMKKTIPKPTHSRLLCASALGLLLSLFAVISMADGVVLWNKLGSDYEVTHSGFGPNGSLHQGDAAIVYGSVKFNKGINVQGDSYSPNPSLVTFGVSKIASYSGNKGTMSVWVKPDHDSNYSGLARWIMSSNLISDDFSPHIFWWGNNMWFHICAIPFRCTQAGGIVLVPNSKFSFNAGDVFHVALVWDRNGIDGTSDTMRAYINGTLYGAKAETWDPDQKVGDVGIGAADYPQSATIDNLVIWDYAKTDFSDRFNEYPQSSLALISSLGDINKDNSPEIAVITYNPTLKKTTATVKNAKTGALVKQIIFNGQFVPIKANIFPDLNGNGARDIAVLGVRSSDQAVQVEVRDSLSGVKLSAVSFDSTFKALDLGVVRDISGKGTAGLAVLQENDTELRVQLKNALSGAQIGNINFSSGYKGIDLLVLGGDLNGNKAKEIAVLADNKTVTAADIVEIRDSKTGDLIRTISYGTGQELKQLINLPDLNNSGGPELAVLRANTARVSLKDALSGLPVNTLNYALSQPFKLASVSDSSSQTHLAMLGVRASDGQPRAEVHDALSDTLINKVVFDNYGTTVGFISIPDINGNGVAELMRLREQPGPQKLFAEVRDGRTGMLIQGMYF